MNYGEALAYLDAHATYEQDGAPSRIRPSSACSALSQ
jgi:hypothetical protein